MIENVGIWSLLYTIPIVVGLKLLNDSRKSNNDNALYIVKQFNKWNVYYINEEAIKKLLQCNTVQEIIKITEWEKLK